MAASVPRRDQLASCGPPWARISSAVLTQVERSRAGVPLASETLDRRGQDATFWNEPRRIAWRVRTLNDDVSTWFLEKVGVVTPTDAGHPSSSAWTSLGSSSLGVVESHRSVAAYSVLSHSADRRGCDSARPSQGSSLIRPSIRGHAALPDLLSTMMALMSVGPVFSTL